MDVKTLFTKRVRRYLCAGVATAVTTFVGLSTLTPADAQTCNLYDATRWQLALNDPDIEQTPDYILAVTDAFLTACPERPEFAEASRVAGIAAADLGDAPRAAAYFRDAGPMRDRLSNFYAIATFVAANQADAAWQVRDHMVARWVHRLERHPLVSVSAETVATGTIYQVYFTQAADESNLRAVWVAIPSGPGWPASLAFSRDPMRLQFRKIRAEEFDENIRFVDLHRCHGRRSLGEISTKLSVTEFDIAAHASLLAYLARPDQPETDVKDRVESCVFPGRLLPDPPKP